MIFHLLNAARISHNLHIASKRETEKERQIMGVKLSDNSIAELNDFVCFKSDIETYGRLTKISGNMLTISVYDSETGERWETQQQASRCWKED